MAERKIRCNLRHVAAALRPPARPRVRTGLLGRGAVRRADRRGRRPRDRRLPDRGRRARAAPRSLPAARHRPRGLRARAHGARAAGSEAAGPRRPPDRRGSAVPRRPARDGPRGHRPPVRGQGPRGPGARGAHRRRAGGPAARPHARAPVRGALLRGGDVRAGGAARMPGAAGGVGRLRPGRARPLGAALRGRRGVRGALPAVAAADGGAPARRAERHDRHAQRARAARPRPPAAPRCGDERPPARAARRPTVASLAA